MKSITMPGPSWEDLPSDRIEAARQWLTEVCEYQVTTANYKKSKFFTEDEYVTFELRGCDDKKRQAILDRFLKLPDAYIVGHFMSAALFCMIDFADGYIEMSAGRYLECRITLRPKSRGLK